MKLDDLQELSARRKAGESIKVLASEYCRSAEFVRGVLFALGSNATRDGATNHKHVLVMREAGCSIHEIGFQFGISGERVRQILKKQNAFQGFHRKREKIVYAACRHCGDPVHQRHGETCSRECSKKLSACRRARLGRKVNTMYDSGDTYKQVAEKLQKSVMTVYMARKEFLRSGAQ